MVGSIEGCCGGFWICQAEKGQSQETQGRWLYLQKIWPPQTKKLWIACIIRLPCAMRPKQWGLNMFFLFKLWVWTLGRTALCRACHPFGCVSQFRCFLCLQKKMLTNWVSPQNDIVCDCVCVCFAIACFVQFHYNYLLPFDFQHRFVFFSLVAQVAADPDTSELEASKQSFVSLIGRHRLANLHRHRLHVSAQQGSSEVTCSDTWG